MPVSTLAQAGADLCGGTAEPKFDLLVFGVELRSSMPGLQKAN
jgi:hypothetical protein